MVPAIGIEPIFLIYHTSIITIILCRHMVGNVRVELTSYPYQGYVLTVILISYGTPYRARTGHLPRERRLS